MLLVFIPSFSGDVHPRRKRGEDHQGSSCIGFDGGAPHSYVGCVGRLTGFGFVAVLVLGACDDPGGEAAETDGTTGEEATSGPGSAGPSGGTTTASPTSSDPSGTSAPTGATATTDDSTGDSSGGESSTGTASGGVPVFFGAGDVGRTTFSCDLGESWEGNRSFDLEGDDDVCGEVQPITCYDDASGCQFLNGDACQATGNNCDCDHHPGAVQGIAYGDGWWVATWGWGPPGSVRRSQDGMTWETVVDGTTYGGLAYGNGTFMVGSRNPRVSSDGGATWTDAAPADFEAANGETIYNLRQLAFAPAHGGHFVAIATSGDNRDILISSDEGASWWRPAERPDACLQSNRGILSSDDTIVLLGSGGDACTSDDGGQTWTTHAVGADGPGVWDGEQFWWWGNGMAYTSTDGQQWSSEAMTPSLGLGTVAVDPSSGTFVAVRGGWQNWYDRQEFYRSADGVNWEVLDGGAFEGSHRIRHIAFADSESGVCER